MIIYDHTDTSDNRKPKNIMLMLREIFPFYSLIELMYSKASGKGFPRIEVDKINLQPLFNA